MGISRLAMATVTFLGTSSGGGPTVGRNCSSLLLDIQSQPGALKPRLWMVDCAEGTVRQLAHLRVSPSRIDKVFITHLHADHVMGLITLLRSALFPVQNPANIATHGVRVAQPHPVIQIYGPPGIRQFVRANLWMTGSKGMERYVVHELRPTNDEPESEPYPPHPSEWPADPAHNHVASEDGCWRAFASGGAGVSVDAGPIHHRIGEGQEGGCIGYVFRRPRVWSEAEQDEKEEQEEEEQEAEEKTETDEMKIVILGDCYDPSPVLPLLLPPTDSSSSPSVDLLIHEATDSYIPTAIDGRSTRTEEAVAQAAHFRGHSTPEMAGSFAKLIGAKRLVLNHIGSRFPGGLDQPAPAAAGARIVDIWRAVLREIERQASEAWGGGLAKVAEDFTSVEVLLDGSVQPEPQPTPSRQPRERYQPRGGYTRSPRGGGEYPTSRNTSQRGEGRTNDPGRGFTNDSGRGYTNDSGRRYNPEPGRSSHGNSTSRGYHTETSRGFSNDSSSGSVPPAKRRR